MTKPRRTTTHVATSGVPRCDFDPVAALGPCYDSDGAQSWLGLTAEALADAVTHRRILAVQTEPGSIVYPSWQFYSDGNTIPHLSEVLALLSNGIDDPWTWVCWLQAPDDDLDGMTSVAWLAAGHDPEPVIAEAARDASQWAR